MAYAGAMKILFVISEVTPFAKTGGLADVGASLPAALQQLGHDVRLVVPRYRSVDTARWALRPTGVETTVELGPRRHRVALWEGRLPDTGVPVWFADAPALFDRDGLYQTQGRDYPDNLERFSVFCHAVLQWLAQSDWRPDVLHAHDWQAALACAQVTYGSRRPDSEMPLATVLTVHNLAYQGLFPADQWALTGLPRRALTRRGLEHHGQISCLKGGLMTASQLTTVSPTYADHIQTPEFGCGLDGVVRSRREALTGILNGIDLRVWDPRTDPLLPARYNAEDLTGKARCKRALQERSGLPLSADLLIGMVQRVVEQKGLDLLVKALEPLMALPVQVVLLGTGDPVYERRMAEAGRRFPGRLAVHLMFDEPFAHLVEAGADVFLMPSRFEPCGLNQMYSMRYGTVPIVRRVGGLADTVRDVSPSSVADQTATGFVFESYAAAAMLESIGRAVAAYGNRALWGQLMRTGMRQDFSWERSAKAYEAVYALAQQEPAAQGPRRRRWWSHHLRVKAAQRFWSFLQP